MKRAIALMLAAAAFGGCIHIPRYVPYRDPLDAREHLQLGAMYAAQGFRDQARRQYEAARSRDPNSPEPLVGLGNLQFEQGHIELAEKFFRHALEKDPRNSGAENNLAMVFLSRNRLEEAENWAQRALWQNDAIKPYALDTLAEIYLRQKRFSEAETAAEQALADAPPGPSSLIEHLLATQKRLEGLATPGKAFVRP